MDDPTDANRRLSALDDFIAAAEAEVLRLLQVEREAEARLAHLRMTPPVLLWPEGVTLAVDAASRRAEHTADPVPDRPEPRRRAEPTLRREPPPPQPAPVVVEPPQAAMVRSAAAPPASKPEAADESPAAAMPAYAEAAPEPSAQPVVQAALVPVAGPRRPKNLIEALS